MIKILLRIVFICADFKSLEVLIDYHDLMDLKVNIGLKLILWIQRKRLFYKTFKIHQPYLTYLFYIRPFRIYRIFKLRQIVIPGQTEKENSL